MKTKGNKPAPFQKQILDKINEQQLGPDLAKVLKMIIIN